MRLQQESVISLLSEILSFNLFKGMEYFYLKVGMLAVLHWFPTYTFQFVV